MRIPSKIDFNKIRKGRAPLNRESNMINDEQAVENFKVLSNQIRVNILQMLNLIIIFPRRPMSSKKKTLMAGFVLVIFAAK
jgi:hypothetical protein